MATPPPKIGEFDLPVALQHASDVLIKTRTARLLRYTKIVDDMVDKNLWLDSVYAAGQSHRAPGDFAAVALDRGRLPLGVQFVAPLDGESLLIRLAAQLELALPWADRSAPI